MLIFRLIFLFQVSSKNRFPCLSATKPISFLILSCAAALFPLCLNSFSLAPVKLAARDVVWCHRIKAGTTDEAFQEQRFLWERGASRGAGLFSYQDLLHYNNLCKSQENVEKEKKQNGPL